MPEYHIPVLFEEVMEGLDLKSDGVYFDGTLGGGGHTGGILARTASAKVIATDKDGEAIAAATAKLNAYQGRFFPHRADFKEYARVLEEEGVDKLDGFLLDLGISSHQIDDEARGFSYLKENAPLDMRMDLNSPLSAREVVNGYEEKGLKNLLKEYGEEQFASSIARKIVAEREKGRIETCGQLKEIVESCYPAKLRTPACARKTFQAIRIEVNGELRGLRECVQGLTRRLKIGGRGCVITFHSLEDRIIKQVFAEMNTACTCPKSFPVCVCGKKREVELIGRKPYTAGEEELKQNTRSKSAKLRVVRKISE